ncbi:MAG: AbrB family transcriptional regulator, partial [Pseudomonadota bacterium]|nr:AbrB family transcriptional regulator [Pseudomonadota bacterium]
MHRHRDPAHVIPGDSLSQNPDTPSPGLLTRLPQAARWCLLLVLTALVTFTIDIAGLPAAVLLGSTIAGVIFGTNGARLAVPRLPYMAAQAVLGCL